MKLKPFILSVALACFVPLASNLGVVRAQSAQKAQRKAVRYSCPCAEVTSSKRGAVLSVARVSGRPTSCRYCSRGDRNFAATYFVQTRRLGFRMWRLSIKWKALNFYSDLVKADSRDQFHLYHLYDDLSASDCNIPASTTGIEPSRWRCSSFRSASFR